MDKEDHGASCVVECGGSYESQHDTGKNLRTVVVSPRLVDRASASAGAGKKEVELLIPENSPGYKIAICSINVFRNMLSAKCPRWSQKKGCFDCLQEAATTTCTSNACVRPPHENFRLIQLLFDEGPVSRNTNPYS